MSVPRAPVVLQAAGLLLVAACIGRSPAPSGTPSHSPFALADSLRTLERYSEAVPLYRRLRDSLATAGDTAGWWKAELWWAYGQMRLGHPDSAEQALGRVRDLVGGQAERQAWTSVVTSNLLSLQGRFDHAVVEAERARDLAGQTSDAGLQHGVSYALGWVYSMTGRQREAFTVDSEAVARLRTLDRAPRTTLASALNALGIDYYWLGRFSEAAQVLEEALAIYRELGQTRGAIRVLVTLGDVYQRSAEAERSFEAYQEALTYAEQLGELSNEVAVLHNNVAISYRDGGNFGKARSHLERALQIARSTGQPYAEVLALFSLGTLNLMQAKVAEAQRALTAALQLADSLGYTPQRVGILADLAAAAVAAGNPREAMRWSDAASALGDSMGLAISQIPVLQARASALEATGHPDKAVDTYLSGLDLLESWRGRVALGDKRMGIAHTYRTTYAKTVRLLFKRNRIAEAFGVAERARARLLLDLLADRQTEAARGTRSGALEEQLRERLAALETAPPDQRRALDRDIKRIGSSLSALESEARNRDPTVGAARYPAPVSLEEVQAELRGTDRSLLAFFWGDDDVFGWWVTADNIRAARLGSSDSLSALIDFLRGSIESPEAAPNWIAPARSAFRSLIAPLNPGNESETFVIPDGPLVHVPIEVFVPGDDSISWGATRRFAYGPSASVLLALIRAPKTGPWQHAVLAVGNPSAGGTRAHATFRDGSDTDPGPLPNATAEARGIHQLFRSRGADLLIGAEATVKRWLALEPARYRYLHFAAHARVHDRRPERTHLVLSNGSLDLAAIKNLRLQAELVTLSACETALGRRVWGEGVIGLPHAFLAAGARGVLVTLWRVGDRSAADFMRDLYRELHAEQAPAEALRTVRRRWMTSGGPAAHPSRWAPFILVGGVTPQ
jgi:CHAT domain-containing protein/tetratricopeptide (TPR) repeat protein